MRKRKLTPHEILAKNVASSYGLSEAELLPLLQRFTAEELGDLAYTLYRTAEKLGPDAFNVEELYTDILKRRDVL